MLSRWSWLPAMVVLAGLVCVRNTAASNKIARIDVVQSGPQRTVRIGTTIAPVFATYALEDAQQVVVDIAEGDLRQVSGPLEVRDGVLGDVTMQQFRMGTLDVSRVTVALSVHCSTVVQADGNAIVIHACHGALDIPAEPTWVASTEALGVEAFTALAQSAAALAAVGPDLAGDTFAMSDDVNDAIENDDDAHDDGAHDDDAITRRRFARRAKGTAARHQTVAMARRAATAKRMARVAFNRRGARARTVLAHKLGPRVTEARRFAGGTAESHGSIDAWEPIIIEGRRFAADSAEHANDTQTPEPIIIQGRRLAADSAEHANDTQTPGPIIIQGRRFAAALHADASRAPALDDDHGLGPIVIEGRRSVQRGAKHLARATLVAVQRIDHSRILLRVKGGGRFKSRHLANPPRFVVDLSEIRRDTAEKFYALDTDQRASRVRLGDQAFGVRAVFDLRDHHTQARVRRTKDGLIVAFSGRKVPVVHAEQSPEAVVADEADEAPEVQGAQDAPPPAPAVLHPRAKSG